MQGRRSKWFFAIALISGVFAVAGCGSSEKSAPSEKKDPGAFSKYGVYIGASADEIINDLEGECDILVVDAAECTDEQFAEIKENKVSDGGRIYTYLNVGSLETFREYYEEYEYATLGEYESWDGEYWVDITDEGWQEFITKTLADKYVKMGVDGFFVDNLDVCSEYESDEIYKSAESILDELEDYGVDVIVNGAGEKAYSREEVLSV